MFSGLLEILPPCHNSKQKKKTFYRLNFFKILRVSNINDVHFQCKNKNLCFEETWKMKNLHKRWQETYGSLWFYFYNFILWLILFCSVLCRDVKERGRSRCWNMEVSSSRSFFDFCLNRRHVTVARWGNVHNYMDINDDFLSVGTFHRSHLTPGLWL